MGKSSNNVNPAERRVASQLWREQPSQLRVPGELRCEQQPKLPQQEEQSPTKWTMSENAESSFRGLCRRGVPWQGWAAAGAGTSRLRENLTLEDFLKKQRMRELVIVPVFF